MPHVSFAQQDKAVEKVARAWAKSPEYANQLCRAIRYDADRLGGKAAVRPTDVADDVWKIRSLWISLFGLSKAQETAEMLSDRMFPRGGRNK